MPAILNICLKGKIPLFCALFILPLYPPSIVNGPTKLSDIDTIGKRTDRHHQRDLKKWSSHKGNVISEYSDLLKLEADFETESHNSPKDSLRLRQTITVLKERIRRLLAVIYTLNRLESDSQAYVIRISSAKQSTGGMIYNSRSHEVEFWINDSTYSFVHETTHGRQYIKGEIVFNKKSGNSMGDDIDDELEAYKNQFSYEITSLANFEFSTKSPFEVIDSVWLLRLKDTDSVLIYTSKPSKKYNVIGLRHVTVESDTNTLKEAYPSVRSWNKPCPLKDTCYYLFREGYTDSSLYYR
jgi:hypothetical protein